MVRTAAVVAVRAMAAIVIAITATLESLLNSMA